MITLFVAFAGRDFCLKTILKAIDNLDYPKNKLKIVFCDTSSRDEFFKRLKSWLEKKPYADKKIIRYIQNVVLKGDEIFDNCIKMRNISRMYEDTKKFIDTDLVFYVEDDIEIPPDSLKKLLPIMDDSDVVMATGRVMSRFAPNKVRWSQALWYNKKDKVWYCLPPKDEGIERVEGSTWGCSLAKTKVIKDMCLNNYSYPDWGQDAIFADKLRKTKKKIMIDWSIFCGHHDYTGKIFK